MCKRIGKQMARKDIDTHALGTSISWCFSSFKERVIIYTMYNGSQLRSKIIAIQCDGCDYLRVEGILKDWIIRGRGIFLDESEHKRFLSSRASPLSKIFIFYNWKVYVNVCACICMGIGRGEGGSIDDRNHF